MAYNFHKSFCAYLLLLFICLVGLVRCDCNNSNKPGSKNTKPNLQPPDTKDPNSSGKETEPDKPNDKPTTPPLADISIQDIRTIELLYPKAKFLTDMLRALKDDPTQVDINKRDSKPPRGTILHAAVKYDLKKPNLLKDLIRLGADIHAQDDNGQMPLHIAVQKNNVDAVKSLLEQGARLDKLDDNGFTPLHIAARSTTPEIMQTLLEKVLPEDIDNPDNQEYTPLHTAVLHGQLAVVQALLQHGADMYALTPDDKNALHLAAARGHVDIVQELLHQGADKEIRTQDNKTALELTQNPEIIRLLGGVIPPSETIEDELIEDLTSPDKGDKYTLLVDTLLNRTTDINGTDNNRDDNSTALHQAAELANLKAIKILLDRGANINQPDRNGQTALHKAAAADNMAAVELLLAYGASVNIADAHGRTPLFIAPTKTSLHIVKMLVNSGANINVQMQGGYTLLYLEAEQGNRPMVEYLLDKQARVNLQTNFGLSPLYVAAAKGNLDIVNVLIGQGADRNLSLFNMPDKTPLMAAAANGHLPVVQALLEAGAQVHQTDIDAAKTGEIKNLLQTHMVAGT